jgi:hypothetical protein
MNLRTILSLIVAPLVHVERTPGSRFNSGERAAVSSLFVGKTAVVKRLRWTSGNRETMLLFGERHLAINNQQDRVFFSYQDGDGSPYTSHIMLGDAHSPNCFCSGPLTWTIGNLRVNITLKSKTLAAVRAKHNGGKSLYEKLHDQVIAAKKPN